MSYRGNIKGRASSLRRKGFSLIQISRKLGVAKSTLSLWLRDVLLPPAIAERLQKREMTGREKGLAVMKAKRDIEKLQYKKDAHKLLISLRPVFKKNLMQLLCAVLFWCEGSKRNISYQFATETLCHPELAEG